MNTYEVLLQFNGGCYNCPMCPLSASGDRRCVLTGSLIQWRFKAKDQGKKILDVPPEVIITFDPYKQKLKDCPLSKVKLEKKK